MKVLGKKRADINTDIMNEVGQSTTTQKEDLKTEEAVSASEGGQPLIGLVT